MSDGKTIEERVRALELALGDQAAGIVSAIEGATKQAAREIVDTIKGQVDELDRAMRGAVEKIEEQAATTRNEVAALLAAGTEVEARVSHVESELADHETRLVDLEAAK